jgi:hypothetical protein
MINRDSNNSIIRTNIFSKSVGGKKKNKTLKKRKGGLSLFGEKPCAMESENLDTKRKMLKKDAKKALLNYREEFKKLLTKLQEDTKNKCKEYTAAQKDLLKQQEEKQKQKKTFSLFSKLKYKYGGYLNKSLKKKIKKDFNHEEKIFNSHLYHIVNQLYRGGDSDYCASIIKEYQEKVVELKKQFETLLVEYTEKNYNEPLQSARSLYNQCVLRHNEGDVDIPVPTKPRIPVHQASSDIDSESKKLFSSMIAGPEYVDGKLQKPVIIAPTSSNEPKKDDFASFLAQTEKYAEQQRLLQQATKAFAPQQQQKGDNKNESVDFNGTIYTHDSTRNLSDEAKTKLKTEIDKFINDQKPDDKRKKELNKLKGWCNEKKKN